MKKKVRFQESDKNVFDVRNHDKFVSTMTQIFNFAKWFGLPTYGGMWFHLWAVIVLANLMAIEAVGIWKVIRYLSGIATDTFGGRSLIARLSGAIFYGNGLLSFLLSWRLINSWQKISLLWTRTEISSGLKLPPDRIIKTKVYAMTFLVLFCALVEHVLSMISSTKLDIAPAEYLEEYILKSHGFLLQKHDYNLAYGISIFIMSKIATILWNFQDLLIILISMGITSRYKRLNSLVSKYVKYEKKYKKLAKYNAFSYTQIQIWRRLRQGYVQQSALVRLLNNQLGPLVVLCCLNNFYFIILQLFNGISNDERLIDHIYHLFSMGWLMFRACGVVLMASDINVSSRKAISILNMCPTASYNVEIKRLLVMLSNDYISLQGMGFFHLDRGMLLQIIGVIIKYEIILLQYDQ